MFLSEVRPAHRAGGIHQELRWTRNVTAFWPAAFVQQVIAADGLSLRIGQDREGIERSACVVFEQQSSLARSRSIPRLLAETYGIQAFARGCMGRTP